MDLTRLDPFRDIDSFIDRYNRVFNRPLSKSGSNQWAPLVDVSENKKEYEIQMEVPGIKKNDISISVDDDILTVKGERNHKEEEKDVQHHRIERSYGSFIRSFNLPTDVKADDISAEYKDGILDLHLPKSEKPQTKSIDVNIS